MYEETHIYDEQEETWVNMDMVVHQEKIKKFLKTAFGLVHELTRVKRIGPEPEFDVRRLSK